MAITGATTEASFIRIVGAWLSPFDVSRKWFWGDVQPSCRFVAACAKSRFANPTRRLECW
jgi:hypothetical protein